MKQLIFAAFALLLLCGSAFSAGKVVSYDFTIDKSDHVTPVSIAIFPGIPKNPPSASNDYSVVLLDANGTALSTASYSPGFWVNSDPPRETDAAPISGELKYYDTARRLEVRHGAKTLFSYDFPEGRGCNDDGMCGSGENSFSCPKDCAHTTGGVCSPFANGVCDSSCPAGMDPDCKTPANPSGSGNGNEFWPEFFIVLALLAIIAAVAWHLLRRKKKKLAREDASVKEASGKSGKRKKR